MKRKWVKKGLIWIGYELELELKRVAKHCLLRAAYDRDASCMMMVVGAEVIAIAMTTGSVQSKCQCSIDFEWLLRLAWY